MVPSTTVTTLRSKWNRTRAQSEVDLDTPFDIFEIVSGDFGCHYYYH